MNTGTDTLTGMLTHVLGNSIRRQVPKIQEVIDSSAARLEAELSHLGRAMPADRGALMHEVLLSCGAFEKDFGGALDSGHGGRARCFICGLILYWYTVLLLTATRREASYVCSFTQHNLVVGRVYYMENK